MIAGPDRSTNRCFHYIFLGRFPLISIIVENLLTNFQRLAELRLVLNESFRIKD
jgi:hypothetical protein